MKIDEISKNFKDISEWEAYCSAQYKTILSQSKEINELKDKLKEVEKLLANSVPLIEDPNKEPRINIQLLSSEEAIAVMEIEKLKELSLERDLSMEECKKFEIYTKTLLSIRNTTKAKSQDNSLENISADDLLRALSSSNTDNNG